MPGKFTRSSQHDNPAVTDPAFYDSAYYAGMDLRYLNNLHSGRFRAIRQLFPFTANKKILDVGCGGGGITNILSEISTDIIGVDFSPAAIEFAKNRYPHLEMRVMDALDLRKNFAENSFEVVVACDVIEHMDDQDGFMKNCRAVLGDGGYLIISTDLNGEPGTANNLWRVLRACLLPFGWDGIRFLMLRLLEIPRDRLRNYHDNHIKMLSRAQLVALLEKSGFKVEKIMIYNLTHGYVRDCVLDILRVLTRLELRDHQLVLARKI